MRAGQEVAGRRHEIAVGRQWITIRGRAVSESEGLPRDPAVDGSDTIRGSTPAKRGRLLSLRSWGKLMSTERVATFTETPGNLPATGLRRLLGMHFVGCKLPVGRMASFAAFAKLSGVRDRMGHRCLDIVTSGACGCHGRRHGIQNPSRIFHDVHQGR